MLEKILEEQNIEESSFDLGLKAILDDPEARNVLWVILARTGYFGQVYPPTPHAAAFAAGQRDIGQFILDIMDGLEADGLAIMRDDARRRHARRKIKKDENDDSWGEYPSGG